MRFCGSKAAVLMLRGVDGCRAGWLAVAAGPEGPLQSAELHADAASLLAGPWNLSAIDMPIGLPGAEPRACDQLARQRLGIRRSSLFPAPPRLCLDAPDHAEACRLCRQEQGIGLSLQSFHLLAKIRDLDQQLRADGARALRVVETHPELGFCLWNGGRPLAHGKRSREGFAERLALVESEFPGAWQAIRPRWRRRDVADDDILDALAALRSARRLHHGEALSLPDGEPPRDACGLPMRILV
jgi:predicted RNase H-like nuclease